jgi:FKBP-type peptidyl-prolyl cis-trans isomerase
MQLSALFLLASCTTPALALVAPPRTARNNFALRAVGPDDEPSPDEPKVTDGRYDVSKLVGGADDGAGFNQFDPVLKATGFLSRRFGIIGGLTIFAALAAVEGREIFKSFDDATPTAGSAETITTASGLKITELLVGKGGSTPLPGYIIGLRTVVSVGDKVIYNTGDEKPIAFKLGQRPFQNVICQGVEEGIKGMKVGGKRRLEVPKDLAPPGVDLPSGVALTYEVELTEVLSGYF